MKRFEVIPHTADAGIIAYGKTLKELFENAAFGMFSLMADLKGLKVSKSVEIAVQAQDKEELLVHWLNELIFRFEIDGILFHQFQIVSLSETELKALAWGAELAHHRTRLGSPIKGATYHNLKIDHNYLWTAQIIFDM